MPVLDANFIVSAEDARIELHNAGWTVAYTAANGTHQVTGRKAGMRFVAFGVSELDAWLTACDQAQVQERAWRDRN